MDPVNRQIKRRLELKGVTTLSVQRPGNACGWVEVEPARADYFTENEERAVWDVLVISCGHNFDWNLPAWLRTRLIAFYPATPFKKITDSLDQFYECRMYEMLGRTDLS